MKRFLFAALPLAFTLTMAAQTGSMASMPAKTMGAPSTSLTVTTEAGKSVTLTLADLKAMPQETLTAHNGHSNADESYSGPLLSDVLAKAGVVLSDKTEHDMLHQYLVAVGTDKYWAVYSLAEVHPGINSSKVIIAIARSGQPLTTAGQFELIDTSDLKPARWIHNLVSLTLHTPAE